MRCWRARVKARAFPSSMRRAFPQHLSVVIVVGKGFGEAADLAEVADALGPVPLLHGDGAAAADEEPERLEAELRSVRGLGGTEGLVWRLWHAVVGGPPGVGSAL